MLYIKKKLLEVPGFEPVSALPKITIKDHDNHPPPVIPPKDEELPGDCSHTSGKEILIYSRS